MSVQNRSEEDLPEGRDLPHSEDNKFSQEHVLNLSALAVREKAVTLFLLLAMPGTYASELKTLGGIPPIPAIPTASTPIELLRRRPDIIAAER